MKDYGNSRSEAEHRAYWPPHRTCSCEPESTTCGELPTCDTRSWIQKGKEAPQWAKNRWEAKLYPGERQCPHCAGTGKVG